MVKTCVAASFMGGCAGVKLSVMTTANASGEPNGSVAQTSPAMLESFGAQQQAKLVTKIYQLNDKAEVASVGSKLSERELKLLAQLVEGIRVHKRYIALGISFPPYIAGTCMTERHLAALTKMLSW